MTAAAQLWEEEFAILVGSEGAYRGADVRMMTPLKREWTLQRLVKMAKDRARVKPRRR